ncbi:DUF2911 domain-containing protein [Mucilaginibacter sp. SP1R1]|uniref:DUF2911 domain-containing protein n=1 Tax=Mucilaginibacter sp. SP1R1 TaxID=2723091 RepID=UPI00160B25F2|nr:DUF2911 domain-containing protein [Mucilaginibacter sp. SP1R1]MBB6147921.1 hypothetical protein [Mucilaginibacter sp. SP1R1]
MKRFFKTKALLLLAFAMLTTAVSFAQSKKPASPHDSTTAVVAGSTIKIKYGSPYVKGRKILGELVPFDKVWRAGADSSTSVTTSKAIKVEGKTLPAGRYAFFVIPSAKGTWTIIFDKNPKQWGAYTYKESNDQLRVTVKGKTIPKQESLTYTIGKGGFSLKWDTFEVPVAIK